MDIVHGWYQFSFLVRKKILCKQKKNYKRLMQCQICKMYSIYTNFLLFICQCWSCSCWLLHLLPFAVSDRELSTSIDSLILSSLMGSSSFKVESLEQSIGLHSPKSDNFMWPFLSRSRLSGLISLQKIANQIYKAAKWQNNNTLDAFK